MVLRKHQQLQLQFSHFVSASEGRHPEARPTTVEEELDMPHTDRTRSVAKPDLQSQWRIDNDSAEKNQVLVQHNRKQLLLKLRR